MDLAASSDGGGSGVTGNAGGTLERRRSKRSTTLADNERIRVVINCLYHMVNPTQSIWIGLIYLKVEAIRREEHLEKIEAIASEVYHHNANKFTLNHLHSLRSQFLIELGLDTSRTCSQTNIFQKNLSNKTELLCWYICLKWCHHLFVPKHLTIQLKKWIQTILQMYINLKKCYRYCFYPGKYY